MARLLEGKGEFLPPGSRAAFAGPALSVLRAIAALAVLFALLCLFPVCKPGPVGAGQRTDTGHGLEARGGRIYDRWGRVVVFRGVNIANNSKVSPDRLPFAPEEEQHWDILKEMGFNLVRFCVFWDALEPAKGTFGTGYMESVRRLLEKAARRGISIVVDMHQDLFSARLGGDGAPDWVLGEMGIDPLRNDGFGGQFWSFAYTLSKDVRRAFTAFWNSPALRAHYTSSLVELARRLKGNARVIGYDLMNEPHPGDLDNRGGAFENGVLREFYREAAFRLRQAHPGALAFIEPADMNFSWLEEPGIEGAVYASHMYEPVSTTFRVLIFPPELFARLYYVLQKGVADRLGIPLLVGEFGAPWGMVPEGARSRVISAYLDVFERTFTSAAIWDFSVRDQGAWNEEDFSLVDEKGDLKEPATVCRPYARAIAGEPLYQCFDACKRTYTLFYYGPPSAAPTEVYTAGPFHFPEGFTVRVSDGSWRVPGAGHVLEHRPSRTGLHFVRLEPARPFK